MAATKTPAGAAPSSAFRRSSKARRKIPVLIDSGFRSGADVFKALALGATAVGIGRPHIWGLASFGQDGVETVIEILRRELQVMMAQTGADSISKIKRDSLVTKS